MSRSALIKKLTYCVLLWLLLVPLKSWSQEPSNAQSQAKAILNTLKYVRGLDRKQGDVMIGVLYQENDLESEAYARQRTTQLENQKALLKKINVRAEMTTLEKLDQGRIPDILVIPQDFSASYQKIRDLAEKSKFLPLSLDANCARQEICAIGIEMNGGVDIYLNEKVLSACGYDVDAAFRYMAIRL